VRITTLYEFYENDILLTNSCDPYMGHTFANFLHISPDTGHNGWLLRKMPEVRTKPDKMLTD
jgi:hypothetical protein